MELGVISISDIQADPVTGAPFPLRPAPRGDRRLRRRDRAGGPPRHRHQRDLALSDLAREAVVAAITTGTALPEPPGPVGAAVALRALLPRTSVLTAHEQGLLHEWLDRIAIS
jgi:hypothetical protein